MSKTLGSDQLAGDDNLTTVSGNAVTNANEVATTPAGKKAGGASPDEAKMAGTPAQQLSRTQRYSKDPSEASQEAGKDASERAAQMQAVGGMGSRIASKIQGYVTEQTTQQSVTVGVSDEALAGLGLTTEEQSVAKTAFETYQASGKGQEDLNTLRGALGDIDPQLAADANDPQWLNSMYTGAGEAFSGAGDAIDTALDAGTLTLGEVPDLFETGEMEELSELLDVDISGLTLEQLQAKLDEIETDEFSTVDSLQAELVTASPQRRKQIQEELQGMAQTGEWTADKQFESIEKALEQGDSIQFAGEEFTLEELLSDDGISRIVENAAADPEYLEDLAETAPELAAWITSNLDMITELQEDITDRSLLSGKLQADYDEFVSGLGISEELSGTLLGEIDQYAGEDSMAAIEALMDPESDTYNPLLASVVNSPEMNTWLTTNPEYASLLLTEEGELAAPGLMDYITNGGTEMENYLRDADDKAAFIASIADLSEDELGEAVEASKAYKDHREEFDGVWGVLGLKNDKDGFIDDPIQAGKIAMVTESLTAIDTAAPDLLDDPTFGQMIRDGIFDISDLDAIAKNPENFQQAKEAWQIENILETEDPEQILRALTGGKYNIDGMMDIVTGGNNLTPEAAAVKKALLPYLDPEFSTAYYQKETDPEEKQAALFDAVKALMGEGRTSEDLLTGGKGKVYESPAEKIQGLLGAVKHSTKPKKTKDLRKPKTPEPVEEAVTEAPAEEERAPESYVGELAGLEEELAQSDWMSFGSLKGERQKDIKKKIATVWDKLSPEDQQTVRTIKSFNDQIANAEAQGDFHLVKALKKQREDKTGIPASGPIGSGGGDSSESAPLNFMNNLSNFI